MKTHNTPLPAAAICADVGSAIGVVLGRVEGVAVAGALEVAGALVAGDAVGDDDGEDAAGAHAPNTTKRTNSKRFLTANTPFSRGTSHRRTPRATAVFQETGRLCRELRSEP